MNTRIKRILVAIVALLLVMGAYFIATNFNLDKGAKTIHVVIKNDKKVVYEDDVNTDAAKLSELLIEMKEDKDIKLDYEDGTYGMYIKGMGKDKLLKEDASAGKYWTYTSDNNKSCVEADFCDAANTLKIADKDNFVFTLASFE